MSEARVNAALLREANIRDSRGALARGAADGLSLAAAPVFAIMALLTATQHGSAADILCSAGHGSSPLSGMTLMYALMGLFHAVPWVKLVARGGSDGKRNRG